MRLVPALLVTCVLGCTSDAPAVPDAAPDANHEQPVTLTLSGTGTYDTLDGSGDVTCTAPLTIGGMFASASGVDPQGGCQPDGTWTVSVTLAGSGNCASVPTIQSSFVFTVTGQAHNTDIELSGDLGSASEGDNFSISGADNACDASFSMTYYANNDDVVLHPVTTSF